MNVSDHELHAIVRGAIARHVSRQALPPAERAPDLRHASHALFLIAPGSEGDGSCVIEPVVRCNHCGYCQSYGH